MRRLAGSKRKRASRPAHAPCMPQIYILNFLLQPNGGGKNLRTNSFFSFSGQKSVRFGTKADAVCNGQEREYYGGKPLTYAKTP